MKEHLCYNLFVLFSIMFLLASCAEKEPLTVAASPVPAVTLDVNLENMVTSTPQKANLVLELQQANRHVFEMKKGETLQIQPSKIAQEWQLDYDSRLFELLTPQEKIRVPDEDGWLFRALSSGEAQFFFTGIVSCENIDPCPIMPARLELRVRIK